MIRLLWGRPLHTGSPEQAKQLLRFFIKEFRVHDGHLVCRA